MPRTAITTPRLVCRFMGGATRFNGSTSKINTTLYITDYNAITVSFWYKQSQYVSDVRLLANGHTDVDNTGFMFWIVSNKILFHVGNGSTNINAQSVSEIAKNISGKWIHCIGTYNGTVVRIYLNGVLSSNDAISVLSGNIANTAYPVAIGYNPVFNGGYSNGKIAEVKIFNSALTAEQAKELYSTGSVSGVSPVANYALDDQPSTYIDSIGGNNGTGTATTYSSDTPIGERKSGGNFPTTATIDNFNRPNAATLGSNWTDAVGGFSISGGAAVGEDADFNIATLNTAPTSADCEVYAKISDVVTGGKAGVYLRWSGGSGNGYGATVDFLEAGHSINVYRTDSFSDTTILTIAKQFADGDSLGMQMIGSALRIYHKDGDGAWTYLGGVIDATHSAAGSLELITRGTSVKIGSFGGGNVNGFLPTVRPEISNKIFNGGFEWKPDFIAETSTIAKFIDGTTLGNIKNYFGWAVIEKSGTCLASFTDGAMKLSTTAVNSNIAVSPQKSGQANEIINKGIVLKPSTTYRLSGRIKTSLISGSASTGARLFINLYNGAGSYSDTKYAKNSILTTTDWTEYSVEFTTTSTQVRGLLLLNVKGTDGAATLLMDAWFDDITLTKTTPDTRTAV